MANEVRDAKETLAGADEFAAKLGLAPAPEVTAGGQAFMERAFPGVSQKLVGATPEEALEIQRKALQAQAESDPDSLLSMFGLDAMKKLVAGVVDRVKGVDTDLSPGVQTQPPAGAVPATAGQATRQLVSGTQPEEFRRE
jgi:hypothetical protein